MTKTQEIEHLRAFVAALPKDSYLADILAPTVDTITDMIRNDIALPSRLYCVWSDLARANEEQNTLAAQIREQRQELAQLEQSHARFIERRMRDLAEIREKMSDLHALVTE
jgi:RNAse (barnase) inhibitor barstar